ncbi:MAG: BlaI/MecI/CopY family transcriptional regulator [Saprospirales bacterium]|nr:BlaI/MecI/CopY family transcriptional regulator [Saprospirales bacterium]MBK8489402.1 BlaI/MecI/CopY family transcriptional regulator [Saprospirales bacterium]
MIKDKRPKPTESELEILQILWECGPSAVRVVNDRLNLKRDVGYTTTLKLMQIMVDKGLARRNTDNRSHIYEANVEEGATQRRLLDELKDAAFRGSAIKLVVQALGNGNASREELDEIKALIKKLESDEK